MFTVSSFVFFITLCAIFFGAFQSASAQKFDSIERQRDAGHIEDDQRTRSRRTTTIRTFHGMDVDARFKTAEEKLKQANSLGQAFGIIAQALLDLNDSHTYFSRQAQRYQCRIRLANAGNWRSVLHCGVKPR